MILYNKLQLFLYTKIMSYLNNNLNIIMCSRVFKPFKDSALLGHSCQFCFNFIHSYPDEIIVFCGDFYNVLWV